MTEDKTSPPGQVDYPTTPGAYEQELDLFDLCKIIWKMKFFICGSTLLFTLIAVLVSLFYLPVLYRSEAVIQPVITTESSMGLASKIAPVFSGLGLPSLDLDKQKATLMVNFLRSRTLKERIINKFDLLQRIYWRKWDPGKKTWLIDDPIKIPTAVDAIQEEDIDDFYSADHNLESGLVYISYLDRDPGFAAKIVGGVIEELNRYLKYDYVTDAKRHRIFIEEQLERAEKELKYWERQVPNRSITESDILRKKEAAMVVYAELVKQFEVAKVEESREFIAFKVLDTPLVPRKKDKPETVLICGITFVASLTFALFTAFILELLTQAKKREREKAPSHIENPTSRSIPDTGH